jgi:hypothetical protein
MELLARLVMVLLGFALATLGVITFIHSADHALLGVLITFSGFVTILGGLPNYE